MAKPKPHPPRFQAWVDARRRHGLSHAQVQMARELGLNPAKLGKLANHRQQPWKVPLPRFIENLFIERFGRDRPETVSTIEQMACADERRRAERAARRSSDQSPVEQRAQ